MRKCRWVAAILVSLAAVQAWSSQEDWTHLGRDASRQSIAVDGPTKFLQDPNPGCWKVDKDPCVPSIDIEFEGATGPVAYGGKVFAYAQCAEDADHSQVVAWDAVSGRLLWSAPVDKAASWSCSTPCVDSKHNSVLIGSGAKVFAFDVNDHRLIWRSPTELDADVIDASICTATDLPHARAFVTDGGGSIYCINLDATDPCNPFEPGQRIWGYPLPGWAGSPSYADGVVYVACRDGHIYAFDATAMTEPAGPIWPAPGSKPMRGAFYGGVTVTRKVTADGVKRFLYAATCDSASSENNSILVKLDCQDGRMIWDNASVEWTDAIPVVVGDMIFVSGGSGSSSKVRAFRDLGDTAKFLWDTSEALPPDVLVGGWNAQPVYASGKLYVGGTTSSGYFSAYDAIYILDVNLNAGDPGFVSDVALGCGNSPAVTHDSVYSIGPNALMKFYQPRALADINGDGQVNDLDRQALVSAMGTGYPLGTQRADLDLDGDVDQADLAILEAEVASRLP